MLAGAALAGAATLLAPAAADEDKSGKEVVQATCAACHATGKDGAPRIGDRKAWGNLSSRGLTSLTQSALSGIRKMPAHGGNPDVSDLHISRAITYMVNQSGGKWIEPAGKSGPVPVNTTPPERDGQQIVQMQCVKCHLTGESGAPKIGDRDAWVQRLKRGMDDVVRSAFNGHGAMPARGGLTDIHVNEMRNAIAYMFNPASATAVAPVVVASAVQQDANHKVIGNTEIFFGIATTESIRASQNAAQKSHGVATMMVIPAGENYYHVNVSLRDRTSRLPVTNAQVDITVKDPALREESSALDIMAINRNISYGGFIRFSTKGHYRIGVRIQRPDTLQPIETSFDFNRN